MEARYPGTIRVGVAALVAESQKNERGLETAYGEPKRARSWKRRIQPRGACGALRQPSTLLKTAKALGLTIPQVVAAAAGRSSDPMIDRREFVGTLALGLLVAPLAAEAQRIGVTYVVQKTGADWKIAVIVGHDPGSV
jgi:hypothetical protein